MLYRPISSPRFIYPTFDLCIQHQIYISDPDLYIRLGFIYRTRIYIYNIYIYIYISDPDLYIQRWIYISNAGFTYLTPDLYIHRWIYISDSRLIYPTPKLYICCSIYTYIQRQIYISESGFIYPIPGLYI